jgi:hypothetical protein
MTVDPRVARAAAALQLSAEVLDDLVDVLADRLAPSLDRSARPGLLDAAEVARRCGRSREWVYDHAGELGAIALGNGDRPRLGFAPARIDTYLDRQAAASRQSIAPVARDAPQGRRPRAQGGADLLPVRGRSG